MKILIDTREQCPLDFTLWADVDVEAANLATGDYSLAGLVDRFAIERKSVADLVASVTTGRARFERELARLRGFDVAAIVVEGSMLAVAEHKYRSRARPEGVLQSLAAFQVRYGVPTLWCGSPSGCAYTVRALARHYLRQAERTAQAIINAHGDACRAGITKETTL